MSLSLKFFKQSATPNRINKAGYLEQLGEIDNIVIKETENTLNPDFILKTNPLVYNANYVWCSFTSRYYYITGYDMMSGGRIAIHAHVDVLFTYMNEILSSASWVEVADNAADLSDNYDMLHNDFPFTADYDVLGKSASDSLWVSATGGGVNIVLIMK